MDRHSSLLVGMTSLVVLAGCSAPANAGSDAGGTIDGGASGTDSSVVGAVVEADHAGVIARAWCANAFDCDCDTTDADQAACEQMTEDVLDARSGTYRDMGLVYDDACPAALVREIQLVGCRGYRPAEIGCAQCALYYGDLAQGTPCTDVGVRASPCARGLRCLPATTGAAPTCEDPCVVLRRSVGPGEACDAAGTVTCDPLGAHCNGSICVAYPGPGETCDRGMCERTSWCDSSTDLCAPALARGEVCTNGVQCDTRDCADGVCVSFCGPRPF
jgi:hypothetical protein